MRPTPRSLVALALLVAAAPASAQEPRRCSAIPYDLAVATRSDHGVRLIDLARGRVSAEIATGMGPHELAASPDGRRLFVVNMGVYPQVSNGALVFQRGIDSTVTVVDIAGGRVQRQIDLPGYSRPHGLAVSRDGSRVWVTAQDQNEILELDPTTSRITDRWRTPAPAHMVIASPGEDRLYGATTSGASISIIDRATGNVRQIATAAGPEGMALRPGTSELWVANRVANVLTVIDTEGDTAIAALPSGGTFSLKLSFAPDGKTLWVANNNNATLSVIDAERRELVTVVPLATQPLGVAVSPDGRWVAVTTPRTGEVIVLDAGDHDIRCRVKVGSDADGVVWLAAGTRGAAALPDQPMKYLAAARGIGSWIASLDRTDTGAWPSDALRPGSELSLAEGVAGITLFFTQLYHATGDPAFEREMLRGADRLLAGLPGELDRPGFPPHTSFYYGAPGMAFALLQVHLVTGEPRYRDGVERVLASLERGQRRDSPPGGWSDFNDILFGDAGTALFLLHTADAISDPAPRALAVAAGHQLLARAHRHPDGRYWTLRAGIDTNLPNFSHGTAGIGFLMARLFEENGDTAFLDAALDAGAYLRAISTLDTAGLRIPYGIHRTDWRTRYELGWAHGVVGSARFFQQLGRVTRDDAWTAFVEGARRQARTIGSNHPADHGPDRVDRRFGLAGIAEFHLDLHDTGAAAAIANLVLSLATRDGEHLYWTEPRPAFMPDGGEPGALTGLLHGASGLGLLLLRLDAYERDLPWRTAFPDSPLK